jgi:hypothetical protein
MSSADTVLTAVALTAAAAAATGAAIHGAATARGTRWRIRIARITHRRWGQR